MSKSHALYELIYVSTFTPDTDLAEVGTIARHARLTNGPLQITGLLVFDGMRFCQCLEGPDATVLALYERIVLDKRHTNVTLIHEGTVEVRKFQTFAMAFADVIDEEVLGDLEKLTGDSAVSSFDFMCSELDPM